MLYNTKPVIVCYFVKRLIKITKIAHNLLFLLFWHKRHTDTLYDKMPRDGCMTSYKRHTDTLYDKMSRDVCMTPYKRHTDHGYTII